MKYVIKDWMGKVCFFGQQFESFDDAWGFLFERYGHLLDAGNEKEYEECLGEYHVDVLNNDTDKKE